MCDTLGIQCHRVLQSYQRPEGGAPSKQSSSGRPVPGGLAALWPLIALIGVEAGKEIKNYEISSEWTAGTAAAGPGTGRKLEMLMN